MTLNIFFHSHSSQVDLGEKAASKLRIEMKGGQPALKDIKANGVCYGAKDILKMQVMESYEKYFFLRTDIDKIIDDMVYHD